MLTTLPQELFDEVCSYITHRDVLSLQVCCRALNVSASNYLVNTPWPVLLSFAYYGHNDAAVHKASEEFHRELRELAADGPQPLFDHYFCRVGVRMRWVSLLSPCRRLHQLTCSGRC